MRLEEAAEALHGCGYTPTLARADGSYGYWPEAWFDRIVAACSFRSVPPALLRQTRPGGKVLLPLSGGLYGNARVLLTVAGDGTAEGPLLPGTISFMPARTCAAPAYGNPGDWAAGLHEVRSRSVRHAPERITAAAEEAFHLRFLAQSAVPDAQMVTVGGGAAPHRCGLRGRRDARSRGWGMEGPGGRPAEAVEPDRAGPRRLRRRGTSGPGDVQAAGGRRGATAAARTRPAAAPASGVLTGLRQGLVDHLVPPNRASRQTSWPHTVRRRCAPGSTRAARPRQTRRLPWW